MVRETTPFTLFEAVEAAPKGSVIKKRNLRFNVNALADFEQETGMGFGQLMATRAVFATARALLWAGLKHEDGSLTVEKVGTLLGKYMQAGGRIDEALTVAFQAAKEQGAFGEPDKVDDPDGMLGEPKPIGSGVADPNAHAQTDPSENQ